MVRVQRITPELLLASTSQAKMKPRKERPEAILARQTHMSLNGKKIKHIDGLNSCVALRVLYLFDNQIEVLDGLQELAQLTHLYLQHNNINEVGDISMLTKLEKLYVNDNCLPSIDPFGILGHSLVELHISMQRQPVAEGVFGLSTETLRQMRCLRVLSIASNNLSDISPLQHLTALETLDVSKNQVEMLPSVISVLHGCMALSELDLRDNPISTSRQMLDAIIVNGQGLQVLNGRDITPAERPYLQELLRRGVRQPPNDSFTSASSFADNTDATDMDPGT